MAVWSLVIVPVPSALFFKSPETLVYNMLLRSQESQLFHMAADTKRTLEGHWYPDKL